MNPNPFVAPGTPFAVDAQIWIRNDALAPDWLRIGTDITGQGPFNAAFSLTGETDADGDGVADSLDQCPGTPAEAIVDAERVQHRSTRAVQRSGFWRGVEEPWPVRFDHRTRGRSVPTQGLITTQQAEEKIEQAAQSRCGSKH
jgi:hypothetical protein